jgi:hypothetical protein
MLISPRTSLSADPAGWLGADDLVMLVAHDEASTLAINEPVSRASWAQGRAREELTGFTAGSAYPGPAT